MMIKARSGRCCLYGWIQCAVMALESPVQRSRLADDKLTVWAAMALKSALWWLCCCPVHFPVRWVCQNHTRTALDGLGTAFRAKMGLLPTDNRKAVRNGSKLV